MSRNAAKKYGAPVVRKPETHASAWPAKYGEETVTRGSVASLVKKRARKEVAKVVKPPPKPSRKLRLGR